MKNGKYLVAFEVNLNNCNSEEEAIEAIRLMVSDMIDEDKFPEVIFDIVEEEDIEYNTEEDELAELDFDVAS